MAVRLRHKLLLVYLALLAIPWAGCQSISSMEQFLREDRENNLLATARTTALVIEEQSVLNPDPPPVDEKRDLYAHQLTYPVQLDGYHDDWQTYWERARTYRIKNALLSGPQEAGGHNAPEAKVLMGMRGNYLYLYFAVSDDRIIYRNLNRPDPKESDHIHLSFIDPGGRHRQFLIATEAPGWVRGLEQIDNNGSYTYERESRIRGEWQENQSGYGVEIRIPVKMVGQRFGFAITDIDRRDPPEAKTVIGSAHPQVASDLGHLILPVTELEKLLKPVAQEQTRAWVVDSQGRVLAIAGQLMKTTDAWEEEAAPVSSINLILQIIYGLLLQRPPGEFQDELFGASRLEGSEIQQALKGQADTRWRSTPNERLAILSAAHPVRQGDKVVGAVVVEETNNQILSLQNKALEQFFNYGMVIMTAAMLLLVLFAIRLSSRIRTLGRQVDQAISPDGQVRGDIKKIRASDELGDLGRTFADMLQRLRQYTLYLETMAGKLSHELRTPMTVVKSSLENMEFVGVDDAAKVYLERAKDGVNRLNHILTGLSEATRLEKALQTAEKEDFPVNAVVESCVEGYKLAYPDHRFELTLPDHPPHVHGVPELLAQLLDKLVSNAVSFSPKQDPIQVEVGTQNDRIVLTVSNSGPSLPEEMQNSLFDSMVSLRKSKTDTPHLGLGLYIVRLVTEYHNGHVKAANREDGSGVIFTVNLPALKT